MRPHGLKGEVTVSINTDAPAHWESMESIFIEQNGTLVPYFIERFSIQKDKAFLKFESLSTYDQAAALKGHILLLPKSTRPELSDDDFYDDEIIDFQVRDEKLGSLGLVKEIERAGAQRYLLVNHQEKEIMIPVQFPLLTRIIKSKKLIKVNLPDGFLDI